MKNIETVIDDIYGLFGSAKEFDKGIAELYGQALAKLVSERVPEPQREGTLRMSNAGTPCERKLWYTVNTPIELVEKFSNDVRFKFLYGDLIESIVLFLAAEAGHSVEGMQDEVEVLGVKGHRDAIIDGVLVDVKSTTSFGLNDFRNHLTKEKDKFGYITQLQLYLWASQDDPLVLDKDRAAFFAVDKTTGDMVLDFHKRDGLDYAQFIRHKRLVTALPEPPARAYEDQADGASGNKILGTACSYCSFKKLCWPGLRAFNYANKVKYLTKVVKEPLVPEIRT